MHCKTHFLAVVLLIYFFFNLTLGAQEIAEFQSRITVKELKEAPVKLIPYPLSVVWNSKYIEIDKIQIKKIDQLSNSINKELNLLFSDYAFSIDDSASFYIEFKRDVSLSKESYKLRISKNSVLINSKDETGQFYALPTSSI